MQDYREGLQRSGLIMQGHREVAWLQYGLVYLCRGKAGSHSSRYYLLYY